MFTEIKKEFEPKFAPTELDFEAEYYKAASGTARMPEQDAIMYIKRILNAVLAGYSETKGDTRMGRFLRAIAKFFRV